MTLNFRTEEPVVGLARQRELVHAVLEASSADETRWLEWKSQLDVSKAAGAFAVSKAILGFANRMPDVAEQWAGGHAYLLVGAEEGALHGVATYDIEKVDAWLGRYLGNFDRYQFTYVPLDTDDGKRHVMLVDVSPPRWGDPIHPLRQAYDKHYPGTVFHRYAGKTEPARAAEIDALTERARRAAKRVNVDVTVTTGTVAVVAPSKGTRDKIINFFREELMKQLDTAPPKKSKKALGYPFTTAFDTYQSVMAPEYRSAEDFEKEVEDYLRDFDRAMQQSLVQAVRDAMAPLTLKLTNPGEENLTQVEVVLSLPGTVSAHVTDDDEEIDWPDRPKEYGTATVPLGARAFAGLAAVRPPAFSLSPLPTPEVEQEDGCTIVRFPSVDLRPHESVALDPITLFTTEEGGPVVVQWRATATNVSSRAQRATSIPTQRLELDLRAVFLPMIEVSDDGPEG